MIVKPFRGLRPRGAAASRVPSYPYDVVSAAEARALTRDDPYSFLHVVRPEVDLDPGIDPYDEQVYARGGQNLRSMIERGWLVRDDEPAYYIYRLEMDGRAQTGIVGAAAVDDYLEGRIMRHEHTRPDKERDRVRLSEALSAHPGPVFLTYKGLPELNAMVAGIAAGEPEVRFTAPDGIEHALWVVEGQGPGAAVEALLGKVRNSYVADGHHRAAAAARVCAEHRGRADRPNGTEPWNYFLVAMFPADQLRILDYNRVVKDLNGLDPESFTERVRRAGFEVRKGHRSKRPPEPGTFGMYLNGEWYLLIGPPEATPRDDADTVSSGKLETNVGRLDVSVLTSRLLQPVLGIGDLRTDRRIDFVGGIRGMEELERRVDSGDAAVAFALFPTSLDQVMQVADAGEIMPPKSTWFEPKLRSGMVVLPLEGQTL